MSQTRSHVDREVALRCMGQHLREPNRNRGLNKSHLPKTALTVGTMCNFHLMPAGWRSRDQLLKMYGQNVGLVDSMVEAKRRSGAWKEHPDLPGVSEAILYYVVPSLDTNLWSRIDLPSRSW